jgi:hypothetical protein
MLKEMIRRALCYWSPIVALLVICSPGQVYAETAVFKVSDIEVGTTAKGIVHRVATIADLRLITGSPGRSAVQVLGYYAAGDGGGGPVRRWVDGKGVGYYTAVTGVEPDDGVSIIVPTGGDGSEAWLWEWLGKDTRVSAEVFGIIQGVEFSHTVIASAYQVVDSVFFGAGTYICDYISVPAGKSILTAGKTTIFQQKTGVPVGTRLINIIGSNATVESCTLRGNIATDTDEQNHGIFCRADAATGNISMITIGDIHGVDIRGDVVYIGQGVTGEIVSQIMIGNVSGNNIFRNVLSVVSGTDIDVASVTGSQVGFMMFDIESNAGSGTSENIHIGYCKGHRVGSIGTTSADFTSGVVIDYLDINPTYVSASDPVYPTVYYIDDGFVVRNTKDLHIGFLKASGYNRSAIWVINGSGEIGLEEIVIDYLDVSDCAKTDVVYYTYLNLGVSNFVIGMAKVSVLSANHRFIDSAVNGRIGHIDAVLDNDATLVRASTNTRITSAKVEGAGRIFTNCSGCTIENLVADAASPLTYLASYSTNCFFKNCVITATVAVFNSGYDTHNVENSNLNGVYYGQGHYKKSWASSELDSLTSVVNTAFKYYGKTIINSTTGRVVYASGSAASSVWKNADGTTAHTPI